MSSYIDLKFINDVSSRLSLFKKKGDYLFNFRCPHCGDSKKNKTKARAYLYRKKNDMFFKCHNCGLGQNLANFIKFVDPRMHDLYLLERYKGDAPSKKPTFGSFVPQFDEKETNFLDDLRKVSDLPENHPVYQYVVDRKIPEEYFNILYLADKFKAFVNKHKPRTFPNEKYEHPRLIIPFFNSQGKPFAFQGRAFGNEEPKYLTIKFDDDMQKIYGLERINYQRHIYVVEGPIDSLFLNNCLAAGGADLYVDKVAPENVTYIFDNEPRNAEIVKRMEDVIDKGYNLVVWPDYIKQKDINDMVKSGLEVGELISTNTYSNLQALTKLTEFKRC